MLLLIAIAYLHISAYAARVLTLPRRSQLDGDPYSTVGLTYQDIHFYARGDRTRISAWYIPAPNSTRAIILVHGKDSCRTGEFQGNALNLAAALRRKGFTILMLDLRGHGQSGDGRFTFGLRERRDILGATDWLLRQNFAAGKIGLLGVSLGAASSIGATADEPAVGALVSDSAYADIVPVLKAQFCKASGLPRFFLPATLLMGRLVVGEDISTVRPVDEIARIAPRPILLIHSADDQLIPPSHAQQLAAASGAAELWITPEGGHAQSYSSNPAAYVERVTAFFTAALK